MVRAIERRELSCGAEQLSPFALDSIGGKSFQPVIYDHWIIQPVSFLRAGCLFITTVALEGGMCTLKLSPAKGHSRFILYYICH